LAADLLDENKISSGSSSSCSTCVLKKARTSPPSISAKSLSRFRCLGIEAMIDQSSAPTEAGGAGYRAGKKTGGGILCGPGNEGQQGQANPALLNELVTKKLEG